MKPLFQLSAVVIALLAGCATRQAGPAQSAGPTDTCYVCKYNNDLACVCVRVKDSTPRTEHEGQTYYFCSEDCLKAFQKQPAKYLPKPRL